MEEYIPENDRTSQRMNELYKFIDSPSFNKIINKLTDYAEILTIGKLSGIVNYNYRLNSEQTSEIIDFLLEINALSKIHNLAFKGTKDLEDEFISNIFSDVTAPNNISSFISIRNLIENRLTHQIQQYNINMGKSNTTLAMPLNELRGHAKTYRDMSQSKLSISTKAQHGIIAASLHDAYVTLISKADWWNDRTYMKFFFNEDDPLKKRTLILSPRERIGITDINANLQHIIQQFADLKLSKTIEEENREPKDSEFERVSSTQHEPKGYIDKMLMTPFGKQYGHKIDALISKIFSNNKADFHESADEIAGAVRDLYEKFEMNPLMFESSAQSGSVVNILNHLLLEDISLRVFAEKYIYPGRKESFAKFYTENQKKQVEDFIFQICGAYFEEQFKPLFAFIKSGELKKFACAYIIKRIYLKYGENLSRFGYYLVRAIARAGGIREQ